MVFYLTVITYLVMKLRNMIDCFCKIIQITQSFWFPKESISNLMKKACNTRDFCILLLLQIYQERQHAFSRSSGVSFEAQFMFLQLIQLSGSIAGITCHIKG